MGIGMGMQVENPMRMGMGMRMKVEYTVGMGMEMDIINGNEDGDEGYELRPKHDPLSSLVLTHTRLE